MRECNLYQVNVDIVDTRGRTRVENHSFSLCISSGEHRARPCIDIVDKAPLPPVFAAVLVGRAWRVRCPSCGAGHRLERHCERAEGLSGSGTSIERERP